jgi:hypothetical protein
MAIDGQRFPRFDLPDVPHARWSYLREHAGQEVTLTLLSETAASATCESRLRVPDRSRARWGSSSTRNLRAGARSSHDPLTSLAVGASRTHRCGDAHPARAGRAGDQPDQPAGRGPGRHRRLNALPFPPLDGGRMAVSLIQAVTSNRISEAAERLVYLTGFILLMLLLVVGHAVRHRHPDRQRGGPLTMAPPAGGPSASTSAACPSARTTRSSSSR